MFARVLGALFLAAGCLEAGEMFELVRLDEGVYAALVKPRPPTYVFANALVVLGDDAVLVVDTHQAPSAAEEVVAEIGKLTSLPVRYVVNTHWHGDHVYGNQTYAKHFSGVAFVGHHATVEGVLGPGVAYRDEELATLPESIREREARLASEALTAEERERTDYSRRARTRYLEELRSLQLVPPNLTLTTKVAVDLGGRIVEIAHLGPAHTRGDVVVYLPREKILAVGDLLEDAFPYFGDSYPSGWADAVAAIARYDAGVLLPSHGPVLRDKELLETESRLLRSLVDEVRAALAKGRTLEETQSEVTLDAFQSFFTRGDPERIPNFRDSVRQAVERAYREARGELRN
jgi:glyoxylase-like metal-dependent hydrolase (beta-lactamase superfamily II)